MNFNYWVVHKVTQMTQLNSQIFYSWLVFFIPETLVQFSLLACVKLKATVSCMAEVDLRTKILFHSLHQKKKNICPNHL